MFTMYFCFVLVHSAWEPKISGISLFESLIFQDESSKRDKTTKTQKSGVTSLISKNFLLNLCSKFLVNKLYSSLTDTALNIVSS